MRRGLIERSFEELPDSVLDARVARLLAALAEARLDALVVHTNNTQPGGASWLAGFVPYWSEALLVVPPDGAPRLVAALSYRVKSWIERTSRLAEVLHTPRIGLEAGKLIATAKADAAVGVVDFDNLYAGIADDLREGGPQLTFSDASALFSRVRGHADSTEFKIATKAAEIATQALAKVPRQPRMLGDVVAAVEREARLLGAEEIYLAAAADLARDQRMMRPEGNIALGETFALRASVAYKGAWVRLGKTHSRSGAFGENRKMAAQMFAGAIARLPDVKGFETFPFWLVEGCRTTQPLAPLMGSKVTQQQSLHADALVSVQARIIIDGQTIFLAAPAMISGDRARARLLIELAAN